MSEHTPGPWICDSSTFEFDGARFGECAYILSKEREQFPAVAANARLIAAAPDLLNALQAFILAFESEKVFFGAEYDAACAAIAKARGQQP